MTLQKYLWFSYCQSHSPLCTYLTHNIVKYLKIRGDGALPLWLFLEEGKNAFFKQQDRSFLFSFLDKRSVLTFPPGSYCYLYCRWRSPACDHWCCLKVLLTSLKFDSGCSNYCPDGVHFSNAVYCDRFNARFPFSFLSVFFLFSSVGCFAKLFWKALSHGLSLHNLARSYTEMYI